MNDFFETWRSLTRGTRFQIMFYGGTGILGIFAFLGPSVLPYEKWQPILTGLGIAFVSSSILGFAHRLFFYDDFKSEMQGLVQESLNSYLAKHMFPFFNDGVERLYTDRQSAISAFSSYIRNEREQIVIIGSSLKGLLDPSEEDKQKRAFADLLREKIKEKVPIRFLLTHPALAFLREGAERRLSGDIKQEIIRTLKYLVGGSYIPEGHPFIEVPFQNICLYHGTPTLFCIITSDKMLFNAYTYQATAWENFCFEISKRGEHDLFSKTFRSHYQRPWENEDTRTKLTPDIMDKIEDISIYNLFPDQEKTSNYTSDKDKTSEEIANIKVHSEKI